MLRHLIDLDFKTNGYWEDLNKIEERVVSHVTPRLIGILETDGRAIKPCYATRLSGKAIRGRPTRLEISTSSIRALYAHNEFEIGDWRCSYNKIHNKEWDDRNRMYCVYFNVIYSVNYGSQGQAVRQQPYGDMFYLIDKYAPVKKGEQSPGD